MTIPTPVPDCSTAETVARRSDHDTIEVHADVGGKIVRFLIDNEDPVMAGQPLLEVE